MNLDLLDRRRVEQAYPLFDESTPKKFSDITSGQRMSHIDEFMLAVQARKKKYQ